MKVPFYIYKKVQTTFDSMVFGVFFLIFLKYDICLKLYQWNKLHVYMYQIFYLKTSTHIHKLFYTKTVFMHILIGMTFFGDPMNCNIQFGF